MSNERENTDAMKEAGKAAAQWVKGFIDRASRSPTPVEAWFSALGWQAARQSAGANETTLRVLSSHAIRKHEGVTIFGDPAQVLKVMAVIESAGATPDQVVKPTATLVTFDEFVQYGKDHGANIVNGMPWHFVFNGYVVTHENDDLYLILGAGGDDIRFKRGEVLVATAFGEYRLLQVLKPPAGATGREPLYEHCIEDRFEVSWRKVTKEIFDALPEDKRRIVYAAPIGDNGAAHVRMATRTASGPELHAALAESQPSESKRVELTPTDIRAIANSYDLDNAPLIVEFSRALLARVSAKGE